MVAPSPFADSKQPVRRSFHRCFSYALEGKSYSGTFYSSHPWENEAEVPILYNARNPVESCVCDDDESTVVPVLVECVLSLLLEGG